MKKTPGKKIESKSTALVIVDFQGTLSRLVPDHEKLIATVKLMIKGAKLFGLKTVLTEHVPEKLGPTHPDVAALLKDIDPVTKDIFSCCGTRTFLDKLKENIKTVLLTGIETHICVYQTACDLLEKGYRVEIITDATGSRFQEDKKVGLERMCSMGAGIMTAELCLYELQGRASGDRFRELTGLVKDRDRKLKTL